MFQSFKEKKIQTPDFDCACTCLQNHFTQRVFKKRCWFGFCSFICHISFIGVGGQIFNHHALLIFKRIDLLFIVEWLWNILIFMPPDQMIRDILFLSCLFVCLSVCLSVVNFNLCYNFWTVRDRDFIFGMHTALMTPFQMAPRSMTLWL